MLQYRLQRISFSPVVLLNQRCLTNHNQELNSAVVKECIISVLAHTFHTMYKSSPETHPILYIKEIITDLSTSDSEEGV